MINTMWNTHSEIAKCRHKWINSSTETKPFKGLISNQNGNFAMIIKKEIKEKQESKEWL